ncbi:hypothetical protein ACX80U_10640 [Arthrobacter sp. TmT3-37]|uniref:hypothetical protein n=1 Tax=Arthrobacter agilis TaxID=37921 RepID=UPI0010544313|nr:hypothetical protein [Arthrobacter agilis]
MSADHLERVVAAVRSSSPATGAHPVVDPFPPAELQVAVASAVSSGESLAVVAAVADLPALAVLDAVDALQPGST